MDENTMFQIDTCWDDVSDEDFWEASQGGDDCLTPEEAWGEVYMSQFD
jgi:hypothetical protein